LSRFSRSASLRRLFAARHRSEQADVCRSVIGPPHTGQRAGEPTTTTPAAARAERSATGTRSRGNMAPHTSWGFSVVRMALARPWGLGGGLPCWGSCEPRLPAAPPLAAAEPPGVLLEREQEPRLRDGNQDVARGRVSGRSHGGHRLGTAGRRPWCAARSRTPDRSRGSAGACRATMA
jgi:hypothetical protein